MPSPAGTPVDRVVYRSPARFQSRRPGCLWSGHGKDGALINNRDGDWYIMYRDDGVSGMGVIRCGVSHV